MMAGDTEVGQQSINLLHFVITHPVFEVTEVASDKRETIIVHDIPLGILILVKTEKPTLGTQVPKDLTTMPATTEGYIHINAVGLDVKPANALLEEYWNVICFGCRYHRIVSAFMIFSNS